MVKSLENSGQKHYRAEREAEKLGRKEGKKLWYHKSLKNNGE